MLKNKIQTRQAGIMMYGITPPKQSHSPEEIREISRRHIERIRKLTIDGLIVYDVQDETDRIQEKRPFPFSPMIESVRYVDEYLPELDIPKIVYRCVGKYKRQEFCDWLTKPSAGDRFTVFVGAASTRQKVELTLHEAYELRKKLNPELVLGGVLIPERHAKHGDEHLRLIRKMADGCSFFVSQAVYNAEAAKNFLSDYYYYCQKQNIAMAPVLMNLTPCGSTKTLDFMKWLGINIPHWLENDLMNSHDILDQSVTLIKQNFAELLDFSLDKGIPLGCSIESVSTRKVEIEASVQLAQDIRSLLTKKLPDFVY